jgi:nucleotide-binding universal stress UspA family protein
MNILLAIDSSVGSMDAVSEVAARPWPEHTAVHILSVVETGHFITVPALIQSATEAAQALVKNAADRLSSCGLDISTAVIQGHARTSIVEYAEGWGADFVIVGSHGHGAFARLLLGSVAQAVVRHAPCSVEVVRAVAYERARATRGLKILLATDGSDCSIAAARSVAGRPWPEGSEVNLLSAVYVVVPPDGWHVDPKLVDLLWSEAEDQAHQAVADARKILVPAGLKVTTTLLRGDPRGVIIDQAKEWSARLIVLGSHGRRGLSRMFLGSVSEAVVTKAHCSVEVIRERILAAT